MKNNFETHQRTCKNKYVTAVSVPVQRRVRGAAMTEDAAPIPSKRGAPNLGSRIEFDPPKTRDIRAAFAFAAPSSDERAAESPNPRPLKRNAAENEAVGMMMRNIRRIFPHVSDAAIEESLRASSFDEEAAVAALLERQSESSAAEVCEHGNSSGCAECSDFFAAHGGRSDRRSMESTSELPSFDIGGSDIPRSSAPDATFELPSPGVGGSDIQRSSAPLGVIISWASDFMDHVRTPLNSLLQQYDRFFRGRENRVRALMRDMEDQQRQLREDFGVLREELEAKEAELKQTQESVQTANSLADATWLCYMANGNAFCDVCSE